MRNVAKRKHFTSINLIKIDEEDQENNTNRSKIKCNKIETVIQNKGKMQNIIESTKKYRNAAKANVRHQPKLAGRVFAATSRE